MIKKKTLGNYPFISVIFSIALALFILGSFGIISLFTKNLTKIIRENVEIQIFLHKNITLPEAIQIQKTLSEKAFIVRKNNIPQIEYISKEVAAKNFIQETGENFLQVIGTNPLRDAIILKIHPEFQKTQRFQSIKTEIESIRGVFEVVYPKNIIENINANLTRIGLILLLFASFLFFAVIILINNTIKLALFSQRFLIRSMQLVGATPLFIKRPFLIKSIIYGFIGGTIASTSLFFLLKYIQAKVENIMELQKNKEMLFLYISLVLFGMCVGFFSTLYSINKYLKMSLDELY